MKIGSCKIEQYLNEKCDSKEGATCLDGNMMQTLWFPQYIKSVAKNFLFVMDTKDCFIDYNIIGTDFYYTGDF